MDNHVFAPCRVNAPCSRVNHYFKELDKQIRAPFEQTMSLFSLCLQLTMFYYLCRNKNSNLSHLKRLRICLSGTSLKRPSCSTPSPHQSAVSLRLPTLHTNGRSEVTSCRQTKRQWLQRLCTVRRTSVTSLRNT